MYTPLATMFGATTNSVSIGFKGPGEGVPKKRQREINTNTHTLHAHAYIIHTHIHTYSHTHTITHTHLPHLAAGDRCLEELGTLTDSLAVHVLHVLGGASRGWGDGQFLLLRWWGR